MNVIVNQIVIGYCIGVIQIRIEHLFQLVEHIYFITMIYLISIMSKLNGINSIRKNRNKLSNNIEYKVPQQA